MKHMTIGIIGHVDHGKTALVKALTGIDTDRLKEEKQRGISITLGFSVLRLPTGEIGLIDVPGHEKFVRMMVSGATGIQSVVLVIAANEGVKPQTIEHLDIAALVGIKRGLIAITKCDLSSLYQRSVLVEEIQAFVKGSFLEDAPIIFTSTISGEGIQVLKDHLNALIEKYSLPVTQEIFYLPVDRVFSMPGFGTIVTGTLRRGSLQVDAEVEILPKGLRAKVRGLQIHNQPVQHLESGCRTAVNLRGIQKDQLVRGDALVTPGFLKMTRLLDAELLLLKSAQNSLSSGQIVRLFFGTTEVCARVFLLDQEKLIPGDKSLVQFRCEHEIAVPDQEPFIIRTYSPTHTIGGGKVLYANPAKHRRFDLTVIQRLQILARGNPSEVLVEKLLEANYQGCSIDRLVLELGSTQKQINQLIKELPAVIVNNRIVIHRDVYQEVSCLIYKQLQEFHDNYPTRRGMSQEQLRSLLPDKLSLLVFNWLLKDLSQQNQIETQSGIVKLSGYDPTQNLSQKEQEIARELELQSKSGGLKPPSLEDVVYHSKRKQIYELLVELEVLVPIRDCNSKCTFVFHKDVLRTARKKILKHFSQSEGFTISQVRDVLKISRKYLIPLLEYFDSIGLTKRTGDRRIVISRY